MSDDKLLEKPKSKGLLLKILIGLLIVVLIIVVVFFVLYKGYVDVSDTYSDKYDNIPTLIKEYQTKGADLKNNISYDRSSKTATFIFSKGFFYKSFDYQNKFDFFKTNYNIDIKRFGYEIVPKNKLIYLYIDAIYNDSIHSCVKADIDYSFSSNGIILKLKDYQIGKNLPKQWFDEAMPYKIGDVIYTFKIEDIDGLKDTGFDLKYLENFEYLDNKDIVVKVNIEDIALTLINNGVKSIGIDTDDALYKKTLGKLIPEVVDSVLNNISTNDFTDILKSLFDANTK